jgi:tetrahydromethanopterin S-methyltransferase subunit A
MNLFHEGFPEAAESAPVRCEIDTASASWPPVIGEYFVLSENHNRGVAVSTLASVALAEELARLRPENLCIVGKTETENIGVEKIIKNTVTNPSIHVLLLVGTDPKGHRSGATLLSLCEEGVDDSMRVIGSPGKQPILRNVTREEVEAFRRQVKVVDMIGCEDPDEIAAKIRESTAGVRLSCNQKEFARVVRPVEVASVEIIRAEKSKKVELDEAGYFVILPLRDKGTISVEHYSTDHRLLRIIEGTEPGDIYRTIIGNRWVTELSHAAYLGKELARAELSMRLDFKYVQDGA